MKKIIITTTIMLLGYSGISQSLQQKLSGKKNFREVMSIVENHFSYEEKHPEQFSSNGEKKEFENDYLHWKRWEYYMGSRLDENGNIPNNIPQRINNAFNNYKSHQTQSPATSVGSWNPYGPTGITRYGAGYNSGYGRVSCIAFHPTDANTLYIGTAQGGIWKSTNNGNAWFVLTDDLPISGISGLVVDRTNANIIYALTGDGDGSGGLVFSYGFAQQSIGVLKSTDGGINWQLTGDFPGVSGIFYGYKLIQHPTSASVLFAATSNGIYRTTNGGTSWVQEQAGSFTDIEFRPGDATIMYAAQKGVSSPFWRSTTSGTSWSNGGITGVPTSTTRIAIGVSSSNATMVYLLTGPATGSGSFKGIYRSTNSGFDFISRSTTPNILGYPNDGSDEKHQTTYDLAITVDPGAAGTVLTGGINIWKSTDFGATFGGSSRTQWYDNALTVDYVHADIHNLAYNPLNGWVYSCSDGGVGYSADDGTNWTFISSSLQIMASYHADWYEADENFLACGAQDNGTNLRYTSSNTYRHIYGADGFDCVIKDNNPDTIVYIANGEIHRTTNQGGNETDVSPTGIGFFPQLARAFNNNRVIFAGDGSKLYKSTNFGASWSALTAPAFGSRTLLTCPSSGDRLYCSNGSTTRRSDNATNSATAITFTLISASPGYPSGQTLTDMAVRPTSSLYVYACFGGFSAANKVIVSGDGGDNWVNITGSLPNVPAQSIVVDLNNTVYVGTDVGVFVRTTSMSDWQPFYNFLPKAPVSELIINNTTGRIIASTFGRGNFYTDIYSTCLPNVFVSGFPSGYRFYNASDYVSSTAVIQQGVGNNVAFKGGNYVILNPGFEVKANSEFKGYIGPCTSGGVPLSPAGENETLYVPAKNGVRYPYAIINSISSSKNSASVEVIKEGIYSLTITDKEGNILLTPMQNKALTKADKTIRWNYSFPANKQFYVKLYLENELVHFQEFDSR